MKSKLEEFHGHHLLIKPDNKVEVYGAYGRIVGKDLLIEKARELVLFILNYALKTAD